MNDETTLDSRPVGKLRLVAGFLTLAATMVVTGLFLLPLMLVGLLTGGPRRAKRLAYWTLVQVLQILGPTFVKLGQISSTRRDTMPAALCDEMSKIHDSVRPMSRRKAARALRAAGIDELAEVADESEASGSIACVYRGVLADGRVVAVKLKRPGIDARMRADLALMAGVVRLLERLPQLRGMPLGDLLDYMSRAILGQLDFAREARNAERLRECLAGVPEVHVPVVHHELSAPNCLLFDYVPELDSATPETLPAGVRAQLAARTLEAAHRMMFVEGFVHCDLHPGNLYLTREPARVVVLDAGYCVQLPDGVRALIAEFFGCLVTGDGRRCGEIVLESAVDPSGVDREQFLADMAGIVGALAGPEHRFDMGEFGDQVFKLQQRHGIYAASDFAFPLMSLNVLDGTVRRLSEAVDFQEVGRSDPAADPAAAAADGSGGQGANGRAAPWPSGASTTASPAE